MPCKGSPFSSKPLVIARLIRASVKPLSFNAPYVMLGPMPPFPLAPWQLAHAPELLALPPVNVILSCELFPLTKMSLPLLTDPVAPDDVVELLLAEVTVPPELVVVVWPATVVVVARARLLDVVEVEGQPAASKLKTQMAINANTVVFNRFIKPPEYA
jgi:hypothetical protein